MSPATIIREAQADGVRLTLSPSGTIRVAGDKAVLGRWLPVLRERKAEIIAALSAMIRKRDTGNLATAISAIPATQPEGEETTVAKVATVAVASPKEAQTQPAPEPRWSDYVPANRQELARMMKRTEAFERMGLTFDEIDLVVDRLLRRDREGDDRHLCIECQHVRGSATGWRCDALRGAIPPDWVKIRLQRCPTFKEVSHD